VTPRITHTGGRPAAPAVVRPCPDQSPSRSGRVIQKLSTVPLRGRCTTFPPEDGSGGGPRTGGRLSPRQPCEFACSDQLLRKQHSAHVPKPAGPTQAAPWLYGGNAVASESKALYPGLDTCRTERSRIRTCSLRPSPPSRTSGVCPSPSSGGASPGPTARTSSVRWSAPPTWATSPSASRTASPGATRTGTANGSTYSATASTFSSKQSYGTGRDSSRRFQAVPRADRTVEQNRTWQIKTEKTAPGTESVLRRPR
jgi:hypothetical protein